MRIHVEGVQIQLAVDPAQHRRAARVARQMQRRIVRIVEAVHRVRLVRPFLPRRPAIVEREMLRARIDVVGGCMVERRAVHEGQAIQMPVQRARTEPVAFEHRAIAGVTRAERTRAEVVLRDIQVVRFVETDARDAVKPHCAGLALCRVEDARARADRCGLLRPSTCELVENEDLLHRPVIGDEDLAGRRDRHIRR